MKLILIDSEAETELSDSVATWQPSIGVHRLRKLPLVAAIILCMSACKYWNTDVRAEEDFLSCYKAIVAKENQFEPPSPKIQGRFFQTQIPYDIFLGALNPGILEPGIPKCRALLAGASEGDPARARELVLGAVRRFGVTESAAYLLEDRSVIGRQKLEEIARQTGKASAFFLWARSNDIEDQ